MGDAEGDGIVIAFAQVVQQLFIERGVALGHGVLDGLMGFAEDGDHIGCPGLQAARPGLGDRAGAAYDVLAAL